MDVDRDMYKRSKVTSTEPYISPASSAAIEYRVSNNEVSELVATILVLSYCTIIDVSGW